MSENHIPVIRTISFKTLNTTTSLILLSILAILIAIAIGAPLPDADADPQRFGLSVGGICLFPFCFENNEN